MNGSGGTTATDQGTTTTADRGSGPAIELRAVGRVYGTGHPRGRPTPTGPRVAVIRVGRGARPCPDVRSRRVLPGG